MERTPEGGVTVGLDFGTTNSSLAWVDARAQPELVTFASRAGPTSTFRSILYFDREEEDAPVESSAGPEAIDRYLDAVEKNGRLMQSLKSFLASRLFQSTAVYGRSWRLEDLVAVILRRLRERAEEALDRPVVSAVVGRPVRFVGAQDEADAELGLRRLRAALTNAGFRDVLFEYEPVGAAYHYESQLDHDELIVIADFGGGTSDFSLVRVGPDARRSGNRDETILGNAGVPIAGDAFDGKLIRNLVTPLLGRGASFRSMFDRVLPVPTWIYGHLERWHHLSMLKSPKTMQILLDLRREALEPGKLDALLHLVEHDLGFLLYQAVERTKRELSEQPSATLRFAHDDVRIEAPVSRLEFEEWIGEETDAIAGCVDGLLRDAGVRPEGVDRVFLTGGSSLVPAVRELFARRFGADKLRSGSELTSVASGLALCARERLGSEAPSA